MTTWTPWTPYQISSLIIHTSHSLSIIIVCMQCHQVLTSYNVYHSTYIVYPFTPATHATSLQTDHDPNAHPAPELGLGSGCLRQQPTRHRDANDLLEGGKEEKKKANHLKLGVTQDPRAALMQLSSPRRRGSHSVTLQRPDFLHLPLSASYKRINDRTRSCVATSIERTPYQCASAFLRVYSRRAVSSVSPLRTSAGCGFMPSTPSDPLVMLSAGCNLLA